MCNWDLENGKSLLRADQMTFWPKLKFHILKDGDDGYDNTRIKWNLKFITG